MATELSSLYSTLQSQVDYELSSAGLGADERAPITGKLGQEIRDVEDHHNERAPSLFLRTAPRVLSTLQESLNLRTSRQQENAKLKDGLQQQHVRLLRTGQQAEEATSSRTKWMIGAVILGIIVVVVVLGGVFGAASTGLINIPGITPDATAAPKKFSGDNPNMWSIDAWPIYSGVLSGQMATTSAKYAGSPIINGTGSVQPGMWFETGMSPGNLSYITPYSSVENPSQSRYYHYRMNG